MTQTINSADRDDSGDAELRGRDGNLRMNAYYYAFDETGVVEIDRILSAVACAGKGFHHTEEWGESHDGRESYAEKIQKWANAAAQEFARREPRQ